MSTKYSPQDRKPDEKEIQGKMQGGGEKKSLSLGIKGCPTDIFLTDSAKRILMAQGNWYKVNRGSSDSKLDLHIRDENNTRPTKESRMLSLAESVTPQQATNLRSVHAENVALGNCDQDCELDTEPKTGGRNSVRQWLGRVWGAMTACTCLMFKKKHNKVGIIFDSIDDIAAQ